MSDSAGARLAEEERLARLTGEARDRSWPNVRPVDAATLVILDRSGPVPRVLMGRRHPALKFMPDRFVFPGGRSEAGDSRLPVAGELPPAVAAGLAARCGRPSAARGRRLALAALRETFEETGIVIGRPAASPFPTLPTGNKQDRKEDPWRDFLGTGHVPDLSGLAYLARAITPPRRPKRFDTRFFVVDAARIAHQIEGVVGPDSELVELAWLSLAETAALPLPAITRVVLADLDAALRQGPIEAPRPVPFYFEKNRVFRREWITPEAR
jgi:8-oxo-dGTP pyrophosphatase MutT (NUDIX family)